MELPWATLIVTLVFGQNNKRLVNRHVVILAVNISAASDPLAIKNRAAHGF